MLICHLTLTATILFSFTNYIWLPAKLFVSIVPVNCMQLYSAENDP